MSILQLPNLVLKAERPMRYLYLTVLPVLLVGVACPQQRPAKSIYSLYTVYALDIYIATMTMRAHITCHVDKIIHLFLQFTRFRFSFI